MVELRERVLYGVCCGSAEWVSRRGCWTPQNRRADHYADRCADQYAGGHADQYADGGPNHYADRRATRYADHN